MWGSFSRTWPAGGLGCWLLDKGLRPDRYNADLQAPNVVFLCKNENDGGSAWASLVAAPMPKLDSS